MTELINLLLSGISLGCVYALIALGFVIVFKATGVVNFAHGSVLLLGAYSIARLVDSIGFLPAVLAGAAIAALAAVVIGLLVRRMPSADHTTLAIFTLGVNILLTTDLTRRIGSDVFGLGDPWGDDVVTLGSFSIPEARLATLVVAVLLLVAFGAAFKFSSWGVAMRASAEDGETAALMGIRLGRVGMGAWAVAGALAAVGGLFFTTFPSSGLDANVGLQSLSAFPAAILGGLDSVLGAVVGGLIVGIVVALTSGYQEELSFLGRGLSEVAPYVVMLLVLLARPSGLFGTRELARV